MLIWTRVWDITVYMCSPYNPALRKGALHCQHWAGQEQALLWSFPASRILSEGPSAGFELSDFGYVLVSTSAQTFLLPLSFKSAALSSPAARLFPQQNSPAHPSSLLRCNQKVTSFILLNTNFLYKECKIQIHLTPVFFQHPSRTQGQIL